MTQENLNRIPQNDKIDNLTKVIEYYTSVTHGFEEVYRQLERQVGKLNSELEEKNAELQASLRKTESLQNYLHNILASMDAGVICTDAQELITVFNCAAEKLTGYSEKDVIGKKYSDLFSDKISNRYQPREILRRGEKVVHLEKYLQRTDGNILPVKCSMNLLQTEDGKAIGVVEVFEDMTEYRKMEREIQQGRTLMALGEMAGQVAHQMRNPLGSIAGFAALLERDLENEDSRQRYVRKVIEGVGSMERIIGNLVFLARPIKPSLRKVNLKWLINDVVEHISFQSKEEGKNIQFERRMPKLKIEIMADPHLFQQMILHLLHNAVQSIENEAEIKILLQRTKTHAIRVVISDTGKGIPPEIQKRLFHPFASNKQKGVGLGLPIVRKIIELHNGKIDIKSKVNKGTKVTLELPSGF